MRYLSSSLSDARDGRDAIAYVASQLGYLRPTVIVTLTPTDRTTLPPEAAETHTHLAHAVIRYLGLTAPEELVPFGINSAAGIVDLISRVRTYSSFVITPRILFLSKTFSISCVL